MTEAGPATAIPDRRLAHEKLSDRFDEVMNRYDLERRLDVLVGDFLGGVELDGALVLDAGCGTGWAAERLAARGASVVAFDLGEALVGRARSRSGSPGVVGDCESPPFRPGSFDVVFSTEMIEHTRDPVATLEHLYDLVRPGGHLALSTPNRRWLWAVELADALGVRPYEGLENFVYPRRVASALRARGAEVLRHEGVHLLPFQIPGIHPLLRWLDRFGDRLHPVMINQCVLARKPEAPADVSPSS